MPQASSVPPRKRLRPSVGQVDHEVDATISNVSGKNGEAKAVGSNIILDSDGNKKTKVKASVDHGTFTGNVNAVAQGPTVVRGEQAMQQATLTASVHHVNADNVYTAAAARDVIYNIATAKAHPVPSQSLFPAETFVGRGDELELIKAHIGGCKPISIVAHIGGSKPISIVAHRGMGKSALVAEALKEIPKQELSTLYPGGIIVCQFNDRPNMFVQVEHIIKSLNPEGKIDGHPIDHMQRVLGVKKRCLVILDGLEAIEYQDQQKDKTDLFRQFIEAMGSSGLVITTTDGTQGRGQKLHLTPLVEGPVLLESMIERQDPNSKELCDVLGNVPLAIRLAGHYIKTGNDTVTSYLEWIQTEKTALAGLAEEMNVGEKDKSIKKMMERSVDRLSPLAMSGLGVIGHLALQGFTSELLEVALEKKKRDVTRVIIELEQYGMIRHAGIGTGRHQLEHALVHSYARKYVSVDEMGLSRVGQYYDGLSQAYRNAAGYKVLDLEKDHMVSIAGHLMRQVSSRSFGFRLVDSMANYLDRQGHSEDRRVLLEIQEQEARESGDKAAEAASLCNLGNVYRIRGELSQAEEMYQKALKIETELGSKAGMAKNYGYLGNNVYRVRGELSQAEEKFQKALELHQALGSKEGMAINYCYLGTVYKTRGELSQAEEMYQKSLKIETELGSKEGMARNYGNLGLVYKTRGELSQAEEMYQKSLELNQALGSKKGMAIIYGNLGNVYKTRGELSQADEMYQKALELNQALGSKKGIAIIYGNLGNVYKIQGKLSQAEKMYQKALELNQAIGRKAGMAINYCYLGTVYKTRGELSQAEEMYQKSLKIETELGSKEGMAINYGNLGNVYRVRGELSQAEEKFQKALELHQALGSKEGMAINYGNLGNVYETRGELMQAEDMYQKALELNQALGSKAGMATDYCNFGTVYRVRGELSQAEEMFQKSLKLNKEVGNKEGMAIDFGNLGNVYEKSRGKLSEAEEMYQKSLELNQALGRKEGMAIDFGNLGNVYKTRGELSEAGKMYQKALELNQPIGRKEGMAIDFGNLGNVYITRGELSEAGKMYQKALELNQPIGRKAGVKDNQSIAAKMDQEITASSTPVVLEQLLEDHSRNKFENTVCNDQLAFNTQQEDHIMNLKKQVQVLQAKLTAEIDARQRAEAKYQNLLTNMQSVNMTMQSVNMTMQKMLKK